MLKRPSFRSAATRTLALVAFAAAGQGFAASNPVVTPHVEAQLVSDMAAFEPGKPATVALRLKMEKGWHTYWINPGDSGLPTLIKWTLPEGYAAGPIQWPAPERIDVGPLANYGYEGDVLLLNALQVPANASAGKDAIVKARADWLVCREVCIPDGADLSLTLPVQPNAGADRQWARLIATARAALPAPLIGWKVSASRSGANVAIDLAAATPTRLSEVQFFPYESGKVEAAAKQSLARTQQGYRLQLEAAKEPKGAFTRVAGVLVARDAWGEGLPHAVAIDVPLTAAAAGADATMGAPEALPGLADGSDLSLPLAALFALLGGVLLNLMPCVFPVLSIKILGFAQKSEHHPAAVRRHGLVFAAGVVASFLALAGALFAARAAGEELGWGFQLQSPIMVSVLALLFFVFALNLSGVFEFGEFVPSWLAMAKAKSGYADSFLSGVLAAVIASPCTAPFMGAAMGFAVTQSHVVALTVFAALGVGMALPYVLLAWFPAWLKRLPKSGHWMDRLKQLLAFPLYATVVWLTWVLALQVGIDGAVRLLATLVVVAFAAWLYGQTGRAWRFASLGALVLAVVLAWPIGSVALSASNASQLDEGRWQPFVPAQVEALLAQGKPVFVDFTAAWCVTCQVNKRLVLETAAVQNAFAQHHVTLLRADWTRRDPVITETLARLGRNGVPVYALYRPGRPPLLLPEILREDIVLDELKKL